MFSNNAYVGHISTHINTFLAVLCLSLLVASAIYGWKTAYLRLGKSKKSTTKEDKLRNSFNNICKMIFCFCFTIGVSCVLDYFVL